MTRQEPDAIVVLGAQVLPGGRPSTALRRRVDHAVAVASPLGDVPFLMCGGVGAEPPAEAVVMRRIAVQSGIAPERVILEDRSRTTLQQAEEAARLVGAAGWRRVLVVTDRYHLPRAVFLFRRAGLDAAGSGCGRGDGSLVRWWAGAMREVPAWIKTLLVAIWGRPQRSR
jgi:uncharacterized SAM-binding protein YcdF (DUF218 family)